MADYISAATLAAIARTLPLHERETETARRLARRCFAMRGDHREVHLSEVQLAAWLLMAVEFGRVGVLPTGGGR
jgi:hypothetical protein